MTWLPLVLALHVHEVSAAVVVVVGLVAAALSITGYRAARRTGNRNLGFVTAAFGVFALKGLFGGWALWTRSVEHEALELTLALADLVIIALLVIPLFTRLRRAGS